jgi:histidinol-phosphate aminotransferase
MKQIEGTEWSPLMNYSEIANKGVQTQPVYVPGKPIETVAREYGIDVDSIAKLASNENPLGPSPKAMDAMRRAIDQIQLYPDGACYALREKIAAVRGLKPDSIIVGNGSNEIIELLGHCFLRPGVEVVMGAQAFIVYKLVSLLFGARPVEVPMPNFRHDVEALLGAVNERTAMVFVASPNNPTGQSNTEAELVYLAENLPAGVLLCVDEAYAEYLEQAVDLRHLIEQGRPLIALRTFSKIYGLGGLRVGYGYAAPELIELLQRVRQPFNVNSLAQVGACAALGDLDFVRRCQLANAAGRQQLSAGIKQLGLKCYTGDANFVMCRVGEGRRLFEQLQSRGIIVRPLDAYGLKEYVRISIGTEEENTRLLAEMHRYYKNCVST